MPWDPPVTIAVFLPAFCILLCVTLETAAIPFELKLVSRLQTSCSLSRQGSVCPGTRERHSPLIARMSEARCNGLNEQLDRNMLCKFGVVQVRVHFRDIDSYQFSPRGNAAEQLPGLPEA